MSEEKFSAKLDQVVGSVKEGFGKLTDDKKVEVEGKVDQLVGKLKEGFADAKESVEGLVDGVEKHIDELKTKKSTNDTIGSEDANR
ncbi:CsbD family protein [Streptococcus caprae]|uniref:CsbD family protein n=1 Tax=Streptococcus caprae TaxID=1640501 RepID=A0ABV8CTU4_9STRE